MSPSWVRGVPEVFPVSYGKTIGVPEVVLRCSRGVPHFLWKNHRCPRGGTEVFPRCSPFPMEKRQVFPLTPFGVYKIKKGEGVGVAMQWGLGSPGRLHFFSIVVTICLHTGPGCWASVALQTRPSSEHNRQGRATSIVCIGHSFPIPCPLDLGSFPHTAPLQRH